MNILFGLLDSLVGPHANALSQIANSLSNKTNPYLLYCDSAADSCISHQSILGPSSPYFEASNAEFRRQVCERCKTSFPSEVQRASVIELSSVEIISSLQIPLTVKRVLLAAAIHDCAVIRKKGSFDDFSNDDWKYTGLFYREAVTLFQKTCNIIEAYSINHIFFFGDYAVNSAFKAAASIYCVPYTTLYNLSHKGGDYQRLHFSPMSGAGHMELLKRHWSSYGRILETTINEDDVGELLDDLKMRIFGGGGYFIRSQPMSSKDSLPALNYNNSNQDIITIFLSSDDEEFGLSATLESDIELNKIVSSQSSCPDVSVFGEILDRINTKSAQRQAIGQIDLVLRVVEELQASAPGALIIIRCHPRLAGTNHSSGVEDAFNASTISRRNLKIVRSEESTSSYYLAKISKISIITWSTIGLEVMRMGFPVCVLFPEKAPFPSSIADLELKSYDELAIKKLALQIGQFKNLQSDVRSRLIRSNVYWKYFTYGTCIDVVCSKSVLDYVKTAESIQSSCLAAGALENSQYLRFKHVLGMRLLGRQETNTARILDTLQACISREILNAC
jgi:hypothetical protein